MSEVLNVVPTRMELQNLKSRLKAAQRGYDLLKKKSDALSMKFRGLLKEIREEKLRVGELTREAIFAYTQARFVAQDIAPNVIQSVNAFPVLLFMSIDNVAGVRVPGFTRFANDQERTSLVGLLRGGQQVAKARTAFNELLDSVTRLAELQTSFHTIDGVLKITNRRVNAMEYVLIPRFQNTIAFIDYQLEEGEREEFFRLKKVQNLRKEVQAQAEAVRLARMKDGNGGNVEEKAKSILEESTDDSDLLF